LRNTQIAETELNKVAQQSVAAASEQMQALLLLSVKDLLFNIRQ